MAFSDNFNRANELLDASANWTKVGAANCATIVSNILTFTAAGESLYTCPDQADVNMFVQATRVETLARAYFDIVLRSTDSSNFIGVRYFGGAYQVYKRDTGTFSLLGSYTTASSGSDVLYLEANEDNITFNLNGTTRVGPVAETFNNTETNIGVLPRAVAGAGIDDFSAGGLTPSAGGGGFFGGMSNFGQLGA